jgi:hypothetical protein
MRNSSTEIYGTLCLLYCSNNASTGFWAIIAIEKSKQTKIDKNIFMELVKPK